MRVVYDEEALLEAEDAVSWYEARSPGLGERFVATLRRTVARVVRAPTAHPMRVERGPRTIRRALMAEFPYGIVFEVRDDEIRVLAVEHLKRRPGYWKAR